MDANLRVVPVGIAGELCIAGIGLARGYLNRPDLTAERFVTGSPDYKERLYRTGDLVRQTHAAELVFLGRVDRQCKVRGFRIEPEEIEILLRSLPQVGEAVAVARSLDGGAPELLAYVQCSGDTDNVIDACRSLVRERLPSHMWPSHPRPGPEQMRPGGRVGLHRGEHGLLARRSKPLRSQPPFILAHLPHQLAELLHLGAVPAVHGPGRGNPRQPFRRGWTGAHTAMHPAAAVAHRRRSAGCPGPGSGTAASTGMGHGHGHAPVRHAFHGVLPRRFCPAPPPGLCRSAFTIASFGPARPSSVTPGGSCSSAGGDDTPIPAAAAEPAWTVPTMACPPWCTVRREPFTYGSSG